jgi:hypothetical protein
MAYSYRVYIDESGDDGIRHFRSPGSGGGASHWLIIGACVVRANRDLELVAARDQIKRECKPKSQSRSIHFKDLNHSQRRRACQIVAEQPLRFTTVLGLKKTPRAERFSEKNQLYFYLTRYLLERVSWLCRDMRKRVPEGNGQAQIVFSRRGGMSYDSFKEYLRNLRRRDDVEIHWPSIDIEAVDAQDHSRLAGLQIADCGTSAIAAMIEPDRYGNVEGAYAAEIARKVYNRSGNYMSYGIKMLPRVEEADISE